MTFTPRSGGDDPVAVRLVVLCGRSFSGKSTVAGWLSDGLGGGQVVSFDAINETRGLRGGQGVPLEEWIRTSEIATQQVREGLQLGRTVIVDDTSSPRLLRDGWRSLAAQLHAAMVLVFVDSSVSTTRQRQLANGLNLTRPDVTDAVMAEHLAGFEPPGLDEPAIVVSETSTREQVVSAVAAGLRRLRAEPGHGRSHPATAIWPVRQVGCGCRRGGRCGTGTGRVRWRRWRSRRRRSTAWGGSRCGRRAAHREGRRRHAGPPRAARGEAGLIPTPCRSSSR